MELTVELYSVLDNDVGVSLGVPRGVLEREKKYHLAKNACPTPNKTAKSYILRLAVLKRLNESHMANQHYSHVFEQSPFVLLPSKI